MADENDSFFSDSIRSTRSSRSSSDSEAPLIGDEERLINDLQNRDRPNNSKGSSFGAYINVTCLMAGTGVLGLPEAINKGGWLSLGLIVMSMIIALYTSIIIIRCLYYNGKSRLSSYGEIGQHAFGTFGRYLVEFFHKITLIGVTVLYLVLAAENLDKLAQHYYLGTTAWTCICAAFVGVPFIFTKTLKEVVSISIFGTFATLFCIIAIVILSFADWSNVRNSPDPPSHKILDLSGIPISLATISFSYGGNNVFPHIEESMQKPRHWNRVITAALCTCAAMYSLVAFSGYLVYGNKTLNPILKVLPEGLLLTSASVLIIIHVLLTIPILMTSLAIDIEKYLKITRQHRSKVVEFLLRAVFRISLILLSVGIAVTIPYFDDIMSLLGAMSTCLFVFVLPVLFYLKLFGWERMSLLMLTWNAFVILIGLFGCVIGSINAIKRLFEDFFEG
ncbi:transmembrane amino acid transporter protein [Glomus cerebriforme]|uniref:Transmembrane amino acid transporter protein n=1 Tax=Glomus cerebriforme TaxID=658196 RepID=A0A397T6P3_9GLOM|nr:transmembrane amino acid transporter protein [Glomus cerebriforme]